VNGAGNAYVADQYNDAIRVVSPAGVVTTLAGTPGASGRADGLGATARFYGPIDVAVDGADNVYVADQRNHAIRKITPVGLVSTLAGSAGVSGSADGNGTAARFDQPTGVAIDGAGNVYVADSNNNTIRMITSDGMVTTLAGTAGMVGSAEGMGPAARFHNPTDVALDGAGNLYVADAYNNAIRKITPAGMVTTLAGMAGTAGSADGTGSAARFNFPTGVAVDSTGNVYVADQRNELIRKVTPAGITTTVAGTAGVAGILLGNTPRFAAPESLAIVGDSIVVSDGDAILLLRHGAQ
jgi:sugar lactone lactonase YvrE